jgi:hypothetical protein
MSTKITLKNGYKVMQDADFVNDVAKQKGKDGREDDSEGEKSVHTSHSMVLVT